jgi:hypothetical protein
MDMCAPFFVLRKQRPRDVLMLRPGGCTKCLKASVLLELVLNWKEPRNLKRIWLSNNSMSCLAMLHLYVKLILLNSQEIKINNMQKSASTVNWNLQSDNFYIYRMDTGRLQA